MLLGDLGARIIKIEEPETGDETRYWGPPFLRGESVYFLALNRNKESVALDLKRPSDIAALQRLATEADVVVQNFRPGVAERLGVDYKSLQPDNPSMIYASISGFGLTGPDRGRAGYDLIVQAMSGMMLASGSSGEPAKALLPYSGRTGRTIRFPSHPGGVVREAKDRSRNTRRSFAARIAAVRNVVPLHRMSVDGTSPSAARYREFEHGPLPVAAMPGRAARGGRTERPDLAALLRCLGQAGMGR